jgi:energy-coupling factor transport system permease protein
VASTRSVLTTRVLLTCAAIGVATGLVTAVWTPLHAIAATIVPLYGLVLGFHALPGVIAQQVMRLPWVALITHGIAALVATAIVPVMAGRFLLAAVVFGGVQEGMSALTRYRRWEAWRFLLSGAIVGVLLAIPMWFAFHVSSLPVWAMVVFVVLFIAGPVAWTAVGLAIGAGLRRAGVAPATR